MSSSELEVTRSSRAMLVATLPCAPTFTGLISFDSDTIGSRLVNTLLAGSGSEVRDKVLCVVEAVELG